MSNSNITKRNIIIALILVLMISLSLFAACAKKHVCGHVCPECGLCQSDCEDEACAKKCEGHAEEHRCGHVCPECGLCMDETCEDEVCRLKCPKDHKKEMYVTVNNVRIGLLSDTLVRVELKGAKGFEDRNTYLVSNRDDWETPDFSETTSGGDRVVSTSNYRVYVPSGGTSLEGVRIVSKEGETLWEYTGNTTSNVYLPSPSDELKSWYFTDSPRIVPSDYGYSYNPDSTDPLQGWDFDNNSTDCFVFLPGGDYKQFCSDYVNLTGKSEMISLQMLGYWDSRWYAYDSKTAIDQIKDYTDRGYSIDVLVIDKDWHSDNGIDGVGYQVNTELFPDMAEFLDECHELGINIMFNDHPEPVHGTGNMLDGDEVQYRAQQLTMVLSMGLDYWWYDRNWSVALNKVDPDISVYAMGMYAFQWVTNDYLESITDLNEYAKRALIMGNVDGCLHGKWTYASDISAHRYSIQWTGDINTDTTALAQEIYATVFGGAEVGLPYMSSDLGGHTASVTDDMYIRWLQYGALSTICRVHCTNVDQIGQEGRMPWLFGDTAEEVVHEYVDMRYRLLPLFYSLARENYDTGLPVMRRTDIEYPQYNEASRNDQYMLGENILVAPFDSAERLLPVPEEWLSASGGESGLNATYYNGTDFTNVYTRKIDNSIYFNWENGGPSGMGSDQFSVRWEGNITIGDKDSRLCFFADDGVRAWIDGDKVVDGWNVYDTVLYTDYYKAGTTHTIKVEYREDYGGAHCYMYYAECDENGQMIPNSRTVFIPDGTWIDVWTGERFTGPQTITVAHGLTTSPIFVREGAVLALAENMTNTSAKDWSNMALDIYAGTVSTSTTLYEDDTTTQAYKDGQYRKTLITQEYGDGRHLVTVSAAEGEFVGARAFKTRTWTVRIHALPEWGSLTGVKVNGKSITSSSLRTFNQSFEASPFAFSGAARDGRIYQFVIEDADIYEELAITFSFSKGITAADEPEYDDSKAEISIELGETGNTVNLTEAGETDWAYFGVNGDATSVARKNTDNSYIGELGSYTTCTVNSNTGITSLWTDGSGKYASERGVTSAARSQKDFSLTLKTDTAKRYYVINLGGGYCIAKLTVRDRAGRARTVNFGNLNGSFSYRAIIEATGERESEIAVTYAVLVSKPDGTGSPSNVWVGGVYVTGEVKDPVNIDYTRITASIAEPAEPGDRANLSVTDEEGMTVADWRHFGATDTVSSIGKAGGNVISSVNFSSTHQFYDYKTSIGWNDGDEIESEQGSTNGACSNGTIRLTFNVNEKTSKILLYTGAWHGKNDVRVYNSENKLMASSKQFEAGETSAPRLVEITVDSAIDTVITVEIACTQTQDNGNVSLAAVQVLEKL